MPSRVQSNANSRVDSISCGRLSGQALIAGNQSGPHAKIAVESAKPLSRNERTKADWPLNRGASFLRGWHDETLFELFRGYAICLVD
jgi:hypothetical protein